VTDYPAAIDIGPVSSLSRAILISPDTPEIVLEPLFRPIPEATTKGAKEMVAQAKLAQTFKRETT